MAFTPATLNSKGDGLGSASCEWIYTTADTHGNVAASGYFASVSPTGADKGLKAGDVVFVLSSTGSTGPTCTIHSAASATTINPATLA